MSTVISPELSVLLQQQEVDWDDIQILEEKLRAKRVAYVALAERISRQIATERALPHGASL